MKHFTKLKRLQQTLFQGEQGILISFYPIGEDILSHSLGTQV